MQYLSYAVIFNNKFRMCLSGLFLNEHIFDGIVIPFSHPLNFNMFSFFCLLGRCLQKPFSSLNIEFLDTGGLGHSYLQAIRGITKQKP